MKLCIGWQGHGVSVIVSYRIVKAQLDAGLDEGLYVQITNIQSTMYPAGLWRYNQPYNKQGAARIPSKSCRKQV